MDWDQLIEGADIAANKLHRVHRAYTERDDIKQDILLRVAADGQDLSDYSGNGLITILIKMGDRYCKAERRRYAYHAAEFLYSTDDVRKILKHAYYSEESRSTIPAREDLHHDDIDNKSIATAIWDIDEAMDNLIDSHRGVIEKRYLLGYELDSSERRKLTRAVQNLTDILNTANITGKVESIDG